MIHGLEKKNNVTKRNMQHQKVKYHTIKIKEQREEKGGSKAI